MATDARLYVKRVAEECRALCRGLQRALLDRAEENVEDIHINVEARLYELIGDAAGRRRRFPVTRICNVRNRFRSGMS